MNMDQISDRFDYLMGTIVGNGVTRKELNDSDRLSYGEASALAYLMTTQRKSPAYISAKMVAKGMPEKAWGLKNEKGEKSTTGYNNINGLVTIGRFMHLSTKELIAQGLNDEANVIFSKWASAKKVINPIVRSVAFSEAFTKATRNIGSLDEAIKIAKSIVDADQSATPDDFGGVLTIKVDDTDDGRVEGIATLFATLSDEAKATVLDLLAVRVAGNALVTV